MKFLLLAGFLSGGSFAFAQTNQDISKKVHPALEKFIGIQPKLPDSSQMIFSVDSSLMVKKITGIVLNPQPLQIINSNDSTHTVILTNIEAVMPKESQIINNPVVPKK